MPSFLVLIQARSSRSALVASAAVACAALAVAGCGAGADPAPTPTYVRGTSTASATNFRANTNSCVAFNNARAGEVSAYVTPPWIHLQLGVGTCAAPGQVLAERDGDVTVDAPAGWNHLTLSNRSGSDTNYTLTLTHWH
jgi:hypothetical protein